MQNVAETFKGVNTNFMVDEKGIVLVHPDRDLVLAKKDLSTIPIVKNMMRSTFDNNQNRYKDEATGKYFLGTFKKLGFSGGAIVSIVPEEKVFAAVYALRFRNICLMIAVLCAAVAIVLVFSRTISIPILRLVKASKQIESGDFTTYVEPSSKDEVGMLTRSFNAMAKGLGEREKMKEAFGKFVNEELAEMAMKGTIKLGGERKYCAIFFSDIRSFTSISEKLQPEEVVEFLNQYMTEMVKCVKATGGTVDKFIGDAIMATWGALKPLKNETEAAINACIMMRKALIEFNKGRGGHKKPIIKIGCGVNSGYVISGQIGSNERLEYTVIGDAVNLASRIESLNKPFGSDILISEESYRKVKNIFKVEKMPSVKVKGKEDVQIVYAVLGRKDDPDCYKNMKDLREALQLEFDPNAFGEGKSKSKGKPGEEEKYEFI
jgi:adenylate cyclase